MISVIFFTILYAMLNRFMSKPRTDLEMGAVSENGSSSAKSITTARFEEWFGALASEEDIETGIRERPFNTGRMGIKDAGLIASVLAAIAAAGYATYAAMNSVEGVKSFYEDVPEGAGVIVGAVQAHRQRAAASELNDLGAGGSTTGATSLGEPYWSSTPRRINNMIVSTTDTKRRPANHNFSGGKVQRSLQAFSGHHTMESL
jgi:hypothetical protein